MNNFQTINDAPVIDKENNQPLMYAGEFSSSLGEILTLEQKYNDEHIFLNFSSEQSSIGLPTFGQPFILVYIPNSCRFSIK